MESKKLIYTYDIETISNFFCAVFQYKKHFKVFEISERKDESKELHDFLNSDIFEYLIGFNNVRFDAQVLECFLRDYFDIKEYSGLDKAKKMYEYAQDIIERSRNKEFPPFYETKLSIPQIDLYLESHFNNINKATSLKWVEFSMGYAHVQDIPFKHNEELAVENFDLVISYCKNDVAATREFALKNKELINLRLSQDAEYPHLNLRNKSDSSIGETLFLDFMSKSMGIDKKILKKKQTHHSKIPVVDCMLPYINFKTKEFNSVLDFFKSAVFKAGDPLTYSLKYKGLSYDFGEGGLHASVSDKIFKADDEYIIKDVDVTSYYPTISIVNNYRPAHLGATFSKVYRDIFEKRKTFPKGSANNLSFKLLLNSVYGKSKDPYSFLYDIKFQLQIVINGQLLLAMLAERLSLIENCQIIQCNTDGITIYCKKESDAIVNEICKKWEALTKLELEHVFYKQMCIVNVNNYFSEYTDGKIKYKGTFELDLDKDFHKNNSQRVVQIALKRYFIDGVPLMETIQNHCNVKEYKSPNSKEVIKSRGILDFCIGRKVKSNQNYVLRTNQGEKKVDDKVIRFYISNTKDRLVKKFNDGREQIVCAGYGVEMFMENIKKDEYNIDYNYYVAEALKIITPIEGGNFKIGWQQTLF